MPDKSQTRIWSTPQRIFNQLDREFHFVIDLCADADNAKCDRWLPKDADTSWNGRGVGWLNPPYGRGIASYLKKAVESNRRIVALIPGRTNPPWWHDYVMQAEEIRFVRKKQSFANAVGCKGVPPWGAVIAVFTPWIKGNPLVRSWEVRDAG